MRRNHSPYVTIFRKGHGLSLLISVTEQLRNGETLKRWMIASKVCKLRIVAVVTTILILSCLGSLLGADPSVEVFSEEGAITSVSGEYISLFPQLPFRWTLTTSGGYDDNPDTLPDGAGSMFTQANVTLSKELRTARTQLGLVAGGGVIHYFDRMGGPPTDYTGSINLNLQHQVSERLTLGATVSAAYQAEPEFGTDLGPTRRSGNYFSMADTFAARYMLSPRLSTYSSYQLGLVKYEDDITAMLGDRVDHTLGETLRYAWSPRTTLIGEYRYQVIDYDTAPRDSSTHFVLGGLEYGFSPRATATLVGGATFRMLKEGETDEMVHPNGSASFNYQLSQFTTIRWNASYSVEEPNFTETLVQTTLRFRTGLSITYHPGKHLTGNLAMNYYHDDNTGVALDPATPGVDEQNTTQSGLELSIGAKYAVTERMALDLSFAHTEVDSIGGYSRNIYKAGLAFLF